jgi:hypothetical protein
MGRRPVRAVGGDQDGPRRGHHIDLPRGRLGLELRLQAEHLRKAGKLHEHRTVTDRKDPQRPGDHVRRIR